MRLPRTKSKGSILRTFSFVIVVSPHSWQVVVMDAGREVNVGTDIWEHGRADADLGWFTFSTHFPTR